MSDKISRFKDEIRKELAKGNVDGALAYAESELKANSNHYTSVAVLLSREKRIEKDIRIGVSSRTSNEIIAQQNTIVRSLLEISNQVDESDFLESSSTSNTINSTDRLNELLQKFPDESKSFKELTVEYENFLFNKTVRRIFTGYPSIDLNLQGLDRESLSLVCSADIKEARNFVLNMILEGSVELFNSFFYITLQKTSLHIVDEMLSLKLGFLDESWERESENMLQRVNVVINADIGDDFSVSFDEVSSTTDKINKAILGKNLVSTVDLIVIDNLSFMEDSEPIELIVRKLKRICNTQKIAMLLLSQQELNNDEVVSMPSLESKLDKSIYIDNVLVVENDVMGIKKHYVDFITSNKEKNDAGSVYLSILKSQYGTLDKKKLIYERRTGRITDIWDYDYESNIDTELPF